MKSLHGYARELAIYDQVDKLDLLERATKKWGHEDINTIELYRMNERGESYATMLMFYKMVEACMVEEWYGFNV